LPDNARRIALPISAHATIGVPLPITEQTLTDYAEPMAAYHLHASVVVFLMLPAIHCELGTDGVQISLHHPHIAIHPTQDDASKPALSSLRF
jgi:hypothetical protein